jgi:50S ribosomal protein L16 3-hydroxylase
VEGAPLKLLRHFQPAQEWVLEPGDMLYLPPQWAHDGVAVGGDCMTCSIGFRAASAAGLAAELLQRLAGEAGDLADEAVQTGAAALYRDPAQRATATPGAVPAAMQAFARRAVQRWLARPGALERALGEVLTEPKPRVWFDGGGAHAPGPGGVAQALATRMLYDDRHVFINGESYRAAGRDAGLMRALADRRRLGAADCRRLGAPARALLAEWLEDGWLVPLPADPGDAA